MNLMKQLLPALLALALLTGCGNTEVPAGDTDAPSLPETSPAGAVSAPAAVTDGRSPVKDYDLPTVVVRQMEWGVQNGKPVAMLAELPEQDAAFYAVEDDSGYWALLRWDGSLAEFDWEFATPQCVEPRMWCFDADNDKQDELIVDCYWASGTGVAIHELHIVEKNEDGTLTDHCLPRTMFDDLSSAMRTEVVNGRAYAVLGTELVDITEHLPEDVDLADMEGLIAGDIVYFEMIPDSDWGRIRFLGSAWLDGIFPPTLGYVVDITANVAYKDGVFTLSGIHLNGNE